MSSAFVLFLVLPIATQQAQNANSENDAAKDETRLVFALDEIKVHAVTQNGEIGHKADDITKDAILFFWLFQPLVGQKRDGNQNGINQIIGGFFGNHEWCFFDCGHARFRGHEAPELAVP